MSSQGDGFPRAKTDESLRAERCNTDLALRRSALAGADADRVLRLARERADRLLEAARATADARLPLGEQTHATVALLRHREAEDGALARDREQVDERLDQERRMGLERVSALLVLERQTTDLHLSRERLSADNAVSSRDDFLAQVSHDLRGLMAAQRIYFSLLVKEGAEGDYGRRLSPHIAALAAIDAQMHRLIGDLVDIVAIDAGRLAVALTTQSAVALLSTTVSVFGPLARERSQSLSVEAPPDDVAVEADQERAVQVLGNLLSNAIKFTPRGGTIRVGFEASPDRVTFFVADTGPGVPADQAEHIFGRFNRSADSAGLGLGLFISRRLVDAHGGRLWFESDPARGTVFRFTLRRAGTD